jgi:hypothetical protein
MASVATSLALGVLAGCGLYNDDPDTPKSPARTSPSRSTTYASAATPTAGTSARLPDRELIRRGCHPGDPRSGVNTPLRLVEREPCVTVTGIVGCIFTDEGDGDTHLALLLDPGQSRYLTAGNRAWTCGDDQGPDAAPRMVIEVIPQRCVVRKDNCADRGNFTSPSIPPHGSRVRVTGPWVLDTSTRNGRTLWSEIHPALGIVVDG